MKTSDKIKNILSAPNSWFLEMFNPKPNVITDLKTVEMIKNREMSLSRFGDGEVAIMRGYGIKFQDYDERLSERLKSIANEEFENLMITIPYMIGNLKQSKCFLTPKSYNFWKKHLLYSQGFYNKFFHRSFYGDTNLTRFYVERADKDSRGEYVEKLKNLFCGKKILFVEGKNTHLGVGNDLFGDINAESERYKRIICPSKNAFDKYEQILDSVIANAHKDEMIVIALGPTATVLSRDLAHAGYRALDLGHIDVEYMWWLQGSKEACAIKGKDMTEVAEFSPTDKEDEIYLSQIVEVIK